MPLKNFLQLIRRGEPVVESVPNRVFEQIDENIRYLSDLIDAAGAGSTVYARQVSVESEVLVGMPVYFNKDGQRFERCLAITRTDPTTGVLRTDDSAAVWGVVSVKHNATLADLLIYGYAELDLANAVDGVVEAGTYYLSGVEAGKLVLDRPPIAVPVLRSDGAGRVFVSPVPVDFLDRHVHYHFDLPVVPAGDTTPPSPGGRHVITSPDVALPGWLPADHASFSGKAPPGAAFGYNLAADPSLLEKWPPLPPEQAHMVWDKGLNMDVGGTAVPLGLDGLCVIDRAGIWWMSDCYGDVPWPIDYDSSNPSSYSDSADVECPRHLQMKLELWFSRLNFATDVNAVTSLHSTDVRVKLTCHGTATPATVGDLDITLDLALAVIDDDFDGGLAFKDLVDGNRFKRGWVVEGVYALSGNVTLSGTHTRRLVRDDEDSPLVYQGPVGITVAPQAVLELPVELFRLQSVNEEYLFDLMYLSFPAEEQTALRGKIRVPSATGLTNQKLVLRFRILGRAVGSLPELTVTARRVPRNVDPTQPMALPTLAAEFAVVIDTTGTLSAANQYVEAESEPFDVTDGDVVFFTVQRGDSDGYNAEVGLLDAVGILTQGA